MADFSPNHAKYQARLDFIKLLLVDHLGLSTKVSKQIAITIIANFISIRRGRKIDWSRELNIRARSALLFIIPPLHVLRAFPFLIIPKQYLRTMALNRT